MKVWLGLTERLRPLMNDEYVIARRSAMVIRIVEPAQFICRTTVERRPVSLAGEVVFVEAKWQRTSIAVAIAAWALILAALAYWITFGLETFVNVGLP
jgi:hypothetical protein